MSHSNPPNTDPITRTNVASSKRNTLTISGKVEYEIEISSLTAAKVIALIEDIKMKWRDA
jgi:hypothetical protein